MDHWSPDQRGNGAVVGLLKVNIEHKSGDQGAESESDPKCQIMGVIRPREDDHDDGEVEKSEKGHILGGT